MMKKILSLCLCVALLCGAAGALADDAALRDALAAGKTLVLTKVDLPGGKENWMPVSCSPDGKAVLWRADDSLVLTRDGAVIPVHAAPQRGDGDPYGKLDRWVRMFALSFPGLEGVSWSPDGKYFILSSIQQSLQNGRFYGLILADTENGEAFYVQSWSDRPAENNFGTVYEAHFDASGSNIWFIGRISELSKTDSLFRYSLAENRTELVLEDIGINKVRRHLFEDAYGGWLVMAGSGPAGKADVRDAFFRYKVSGGILSLILGGDGGSGIADRSERMLVTGAMAAACGDYSPVTRYGLSIAFSNFSTSAQQQTEAASTAMRAAAMPSALYTWPRLNRITPEGIDLNRYWELAGDPEDPASMRLVETDPALVDLMNRFAARIPLNEEEQGRMHKESQALLFGGMPRLSCLRMSPGGRYALLTGLLLRPEHSPLCWLVDPASMTLYPVELPDDLGPDYFGTALGAKYRPGIEWTGDTLLIYNSNPNTVEAYRLEAK